MVKNSAENSPVITTFLFLLLPSLLTTLAKKVFAQKRKQHFFQWFHSTHTFAQLDKCISFLFLLLALTLFACKLRWVQVACNYEQLLLNSIKNKQTGKQGDTLTSTLIHFLLFVNTEFASSSNRHLFSRLFVYLFVIDHPGLKVDLVSKSRQYHWQSS